MLFFENSFLQKISLALSSGIAFLLVLQGPAFLDDPFHHGEYFASGIGIINRPETITIHGALDFIPAAIAREIFGNENYFLGTYAIYKALDLFSCMMFLIIAASANRKLGRDWILPPLILLGPWLVGYRDVFLLSSLFLLLSICERVHHPRTEILLSVALGVLTAAGLFWSFDRGIAGAVTVIVTMSLLLLSGREKLAVYFVSFSFIIGLLSKSFPIFSLSNYFENVRFLMETSSQWSFGWLAWPVLLTIFVLLINVLAALIYASGLRTRLDFYERGPEFIALSLISIFMLKIGTNRASLTHIYWSIWAPLLMISHARLGPSNPRRFVGPIAIIAFLSALISLKTDSYITCLVTVIILFAIFPPMRRSMIFQVMFVLAIFSGIALSIFEVEKSLSSEPYVWMTKLLEFPENSAVVSPGPAWAARQIKESGAGCLFDLSNSGIVNGLAQLPSCTRFSYLVYANQRFEEEILSSLQAVAPPAIVYSTNHWSYRIDDRSMRERFPILDTYIIENYKTEKCEYGYCIRYKKEE